MQNDNEKIFELLQFVLNVYGIHPFPENVGIIQRNWVLVYSYVTYATMVIGNLLIIVISRDIFSSITALSVIFGVLYFFLVQYLSARKCRNLRRLIVSLRTHDFGWNASVECWKIEEEIPPQRILFIHRCIASYNVFSYAMVMAFPLFSVWLLHISEIGELGSLLYSCWYPWNVTDFRWYVVTYFIQVIGGSLFQIILYTTTTFNLVILFLFKNCYKELKIVVQNLKFSISVEDFNHDLDQCIKRHQRLTRAFNEYKSWFNVLYASELTYYSLEFLFLGSMAFSNSPDILYKAKSFLLLLNITMLLYIHCWIGTSFYSLNNSIYQTLYAFPWYEMKFIVVRKKISLFMYQTRHPLCLTGFKIFEASLQVFFRILRSSYGYLSVLLATLK